MQVCFEMYWSFVDHLIMQMKLNRIVKIKIIKVFYILQLTDILSKIVCKRYIRFAELGV